MTEKPDTWSTASKWLMGGAAALVVGSVVATGNFVAGAVWEKIVEEIAIEAKAASEEEVNAKIKRLADSDAVTAQEVENLRTTQQVLIQKSGDVEKAVEAQGIIAKQILRLLEAQQ
jgi:hypothetical protein